jgi:site-specific recombinase XerC
VLLDRQALSTMRVLGRGAARDPRGDPLRARGGLFVFVFAGWRLREVAGLERVDLERWQTRLTGKGGKGGKFRCTRQSAKCCVSSSGEPDEASTCSRR